MDVEILARFQFAFTIMFHYIYPPLSIGLGLILVIMEAVYLKTRDPRWEQMAKFWTKVFALTFAIGVATGIVMEFEFGTNWATYSRYVGDVFGSALAAEGVFAFFLESGFLAVLLFGWSKVSPGFHFFSTCMVALGAHFSAVWIIIANSWMQTPAGYHIVGEGMNARAEIVDFWAMVFNPSSMDRLSHAVIGCWLAGAFLVISVGAWYLHKNVHHYFAKQSLKIGMIVGSVALCLQLFTGHKSAQGIAVNQPAKLAAFEGIYKTQAGAPLSLFGIPNSDTQTVSYSIEIPKVLSLLAFNDPNAVVKGLDQYPRKDWPNVRAVFQTYHLMIAMWGWMVLTVIVGWIYWKRQKIEKTAWVLWALILSVFAPQIGNQAGWVSAEMGRYPWIVQDLLRISEGLSKSVTAEHILGSIIMFGILYFFLFLLFIYLLNEKIQHGPTEVVEGSPYHHLQDLVDETAKETPKVNPNG